MKLTVIARGEFSVEWPILEVVVNNIVVGRHTVKDISEADFDISLEHDVNNVCINYVNKQQHHTQINKNTVVADQSLELIGLRLDDIKLQSWITTQGHYKPRYFEGFLQQNPNAQTLLQSQLIWHFPGSFVLPPWPHKDRFWEWYRQQRRFVHASQFTGAAAIRDEGYIGSLDKHQDLVLDIKKILKIDV
jgi:hypothetical protein